jgi:hypothetical protein
MRNLKALFGIAVVVAAFYVAWMVLPPYFVSYQFQDAIESEAKIDSYSTKPESEIQEIVLKKARELDLPINSEDIHVTRTGNEVAIWADYTVHVDLPLYPMDLKFAPSTKNKKI